MELRDIPVSECIPRFAYLAAGLLRLFVICLFPLCMPGLIGHDIRSILFSSRFPSGFFCLKKRKNLNFNQTKGVAAASLYNPTGVLRRYR
jgi:hypothetical protein